MALEGKQNAFVAPTDPAYYAWSVQRELKAIDLSLMCLALVAVLGRIWIRVFRLHVFRLDDYFMVAAMVCSIVSCAIFYHVIELGMGKHIFAVSPQNITPLLMWIWIMGVVIPFAVFFVKVSIAFFLLPLTSRTHYRRFLWGIIVFLIFLIIFAFFSIVFGCMPVRANFDFALRPPPMGTGTAKCLSLDMFRSFALFNSVTNIITDVVLAIIPVPLIWTLQVNMPTKISLIFILSLGFFVCAAGIIKTPLLFHFFDDIDITGNRSWYYAWQLIEMNVGIIAATLPSLKPAFRWLLEAAKALTTGHSANRSGPSHAYKRQSSSGYLRQKETSLAHVYGLGSGNRRTRGFPQDDIEMELRGLEPYHITVAGNEVDENSMVGASGSDASSDKIRKAGAELERERGSRNGRIVKTTKVTIVTS